MKINDNLNNREAVDQIFWISVNHLINYPLGNGQLSWRRLVLVEEMNSEQGRDNSMEFFMVGSHMLVYFVLLVMIFFWDGGGEKRLDNESFR